MEELKFKSLIDDLSDSLNSLHSKKIAIVAVTCSVVALSLLLLHNFAVKTKEKAFHIYHKFFKFFTIAQATYSGISLFYYLSHLMRAYYKHLSLLTPLEECLKLTKDAKEEIANKMYRLTFKRFTQLLGLRPYLLWGACSFILLIFLISVYCSMPIGYEKKLLFIPIAMNLAVTAGILYSALPFLEKLAYFKEMEFYFISRTTVYAFEFLLFMASIVSTYLIFRSFDMECKRQNESSKGAALFSRDFPASIERV